MSQISLKSISGITSITTPAGVDNQLTLHNNNTTEAVKLDIAGNLHFHNHLNITGVSTASNFKTGTSNLHNTGLNVFDLDVDGHTNLDNVSIVGVVTVSSNLNTSRIIAENSSSSVPTAKFTNSGTGNQLELYGSDTSTIRIKTTNGGGVPKIQLRDGYNRDNFISVTDSGDNLVLAVDEGNAGADSTMRFRVDGSERLRIDSSGRVGIGTDSPLGVMHIEGGSNGNLLQLSNDQTGATSSHGFVIGIDASTAYFYHRENKHIKFGTNNAERLRITSDGKLGLGVATPQAAMHIEGGSNGNLLQLSNTNTGATTGDGFVIGINSLLTYVYNRENKDLTFGTNNTERLRITSDGKIGIGMASPSGLLSIKGNGALVHLVKDNDSNNNGIIFKDSSGNNHAAVWHYGSDDALVFWSGGSTERLRITSSGQLLISESSTDTTLNNWTGATLNIKNTSNTDNNKSVIYFSNSAGGTDAAIQAIHEDADGTGTARRGFLSFGTSGSNSSGSVVERARITGDGQFLMGTTSSTGARVIIQQNSSDTNPYDQATSADSSGLRLHNYSFGVGRYTALSMEACNSSTVQSASIIAQSVNSGQAPSIIFAQRTSNSANSERMRINESGYVTKISQPRAFVKIYSTTTLGNAKITNWASPTYNVGNLWDATNSRFVAPVDGLYLIGGNFRIGAPGHIRVIRFNIHAKNTSGTTMAIYGGGVGGTHNYDDGSGGYDHPYVSFTNAIYLQANQYLELHCSETAVQHTSYIQVSNEQSAMWCVLLQ